MSDDICGICIVACLDVVAGICLDFSSIRTSVILLPSSSCQQSITINYQATVLQRIFFDVVAEKIRVEKSITSESR